MVALCSGWHIIALHNSRTLFIGSQVREFSAHYYGDSEIRATGRGILCILERDVQEVVRPFRFLNCQERGAYWICSLGRMGSQNTDVLDQVSRLSRSSTVEVLVRINAPHCWLETDFKSTWTTLSRAFPTTVAPTLQCCFTLFIPALLVVYLIWLTNSSFITNVFVIYIMHFLIFVV